jgi:hypothetical protein
LRPDAGPKPEVVSAAVADFGVWHMAASAAEITWSVPDGDAMPPTGPPTSLRAPVLAPPRKVGSLLGAG